ncbi:MAG: glycoside hydrolase family 4 [Chloroflexi bacterium]|nr:glycoside hydrolase family 4 [Chloroflexota bacterium]
MARIKIAYVGGGSSRAPGTVASFVYQGANFEGSELVLIDLDQERLDIVETIGQKMARNAGIDLRISSTTNRRSGLTDCDAVLTSFRPGGFEARYLDESIPLKHGVIGQETQGPGGFFMALRSINVMQGIVQDMEAVCPKARLVNYTNPINIVSEAISHHSSIPIVSLCEGPLLYPQRVLRAAGIDPSQADIVAIGVNHGSWSVRHEIDGEDVMPNVVAAYEQRRDDPNLTKLQRRMLHLAATMGSLPSEYFQYYYFKDEILAELQAKPTTRAQDIMASVPDYWTHYRAQAASENPTLDPARSRGGIHELELAIDVMDALYNDRKEVLPVNVPNRGAIPGLPDDLIVEVPGYIDRTGIVPLSHGPLPRHLAGLVGALGEYQAVAGEAAWTGTRVDAIRALAANPLVMSLHKAEVIYDEMAAALRHYLPERLLR